MITSSRHQFSITQPYVLKRDRDSENPTVFHVKLQSPEANAVYLGKLSECKQEKGFRESKFVPERYVAVTNEQLCNIIRAIDNVDFEPESGEKSHYDHLENDGSEENTKALKRILMGLDDDDRAELGEAGTKASTLAEGIKKK